MNYLEYQPYSNNLIAAFNWIVGHSKVIIVCSLLFIGILLHNLPNLIKDTSADAFLAANNPALLYKDKVRDLFGLADPIVVAVVDEAEHGVYNPETLALVAWLTEKISSTSNINEARVTSLATEKDIRSDGDELIISRFLEASPREESHSEDVRTAIVNFPIYQGSLVALDGKVTLVIAEMIDEGDAEQTYRDILSLLDEAPTPPGVELHVAGEGAIAGYLGSYIDSDAMRLNPLAGLIITLAIVLAFFRFNPALLSNVIIGASVLITLGVMAGFGIPFFVITSALPVILIGISVADSIHIYSEYYHRQAQNPEAPVADLVVETMMEMWRPITLTTITTMCGFLGLYFASFMPPFKYFGLFAAIGVFVAWVYSMVFLPAAMVLTKPKVSARFAAQLTHCNADIFGRAMARMGNLSLRYSRIVVLLWVVIAGTGLYATSQLVVDEDRIDLFHPSEPIYKADKVINAHMNGTNALDVIVEADVPEGLLEPENLRKIEALQAYVATLPNVGGSISIVDYLKQMNRVLLEGPEEEYRLPDDKDTVAQYFLIYSALGDPTDFEEEVDYDYQTANIRVSMKSGSYLDIKQVVEPLQEYIDTQFNDTGLRATLSGRVSLNYHWFKDLGVSHFSGLAMALLLVWAVSAALFRSAIAGLYALIPVAGAVLLVYAFMVLLGMTLGIGTSMFAAVAIGLGVDFAIHTIDRLRSLYARYGDDPDQIYPEFFQTTGRALFFNFLAISCGFGVLISSKIVSLNNFGNIVVLAVTTSFISSLTLLPALVKLTKPGFIVNFEDKQRPNGRTGNLPALFLAFLVGGIGLTLPEVAQASEGLNGDAIVAQVNTVEDGEFVTRKLTMTMTDRRGKQRQRETLNYRKYVEGDKKTVMFFLKPSNVRDTGFLIWNYADPTEEDDQWLYLPALRKVRRVSAADRGDYFLGTDFTYEDMKLDGKFEPLDYNFVLKGKESLGGVLAYKLEASPRDEDIARELGYSRTVSWIDPNNWMLVKAEFYDLKGNMLKTLTAEDIRQIDGYWTRHQLTMHNHQTGHKTEFVFSEVDYKAPVQNSLFSKRALARGH